MDINEYVNKVILLKTKNNLYLHISNISQHNINPVFILTPDKSDATELLFVKKTNNTIAIRLNSEMKNQNNTIGYHLYSIPTSDLVFGSGNEGAFANFCLEQNADYILIKSGYKNSYLCYEYDIIRLRPLNLEMCSFLIENSEQLNKQSNEKTICIVAYGYPRNQIDLDKSPLISSLSEMYKKENITVYIFVPDTHKNINSNKCNVIVKTHANYDEFFIKQSILLGLPIVTTTGLYSHKLLELFWNLSSATALSSSTYNNYILLDINAIENMEIIKKNFDSSRYYCLNNGFFNCYFSIGKGLLQLKYLYDFFVKNKIMYTNVEPETFIRTYLNSQNISMSEIHFITNCNIISKLSQRCDDNYFKEISTKYIELSFI